MAELQRLVDEGAEGLTVMAEAAACNYPGCPKSRAEKDDDFCLAHAYAARAEAVHLVDEVNHVLRLEAEFQVWCRDNGHPDPHV